MNNGSLHIHMNCVPMLIVPLSSSWAFMPNTVAKKERGSWARVNGEEQRVPRC
jgi:hypothetical protein